jgi:thiosulfate/3-mercaptopyruvate sulfurtransferase
MSYLITAEELNRQPDCVVFDCRYSLTDHDAGRKAWTVDHIPGSQYVDLGVDMSSPPGSGGRHPLPDRDKLVRKLRTWGVSNDSAIVCYDQNSGAIAGRLWWLLRWLGHADVRVLDGGLDAWIAAGFDTTAEAGAVAPGNFRAGKPLTRICDADSLPDPGRCLLDARGAARFRGEVEPLDAVAGHIPGAVCAPFDDNLIDGRLVSAKALKDRFTQLGVTPQSEVVCYCGSGVTAAHNILALLIAGFPEPALYVGSWSEWITDPERPIASGD